MIDITKGEWKIDESVFDDAVIVNLETDGWIDVHGSNTKNNAVAVSAVPEMIEALIDNMRTLEDNHLADTFAYKKTIDALKKAGAEL